ncbi:MAG TPA: DUF2782 domain-containing protein [Burkholderiaceae bacterium]|nr:DUF2782 domain-containing protein [Burkholderiaceae bacterium]
MKPMLVLALACVAAPAWAQTAPNAPSSARPPSALPPQAAPAADRSEPNVRYTVIEDEGSKIDELRVRGQVEHVIVTPKVGVKKSYEIIVGRGGRQVANGTGGADSAIGKRVWNVLAF